MSKSPRDDLPGEAKSAAELTFEKALAELEKIVNRMETGELSLEQALASHKRGLELARFCQARLETAQQQVRVLEGEVLKPLAAAAAADEDERGARREPERCDSVRCVDGLRAVAHRARACAASPRVRHIP